MSPFTALAPHELQFNVERLLARYAQCIDRDELEAWPDFFTEQCLYQVIAWENALRGLPVSAFLCDSRAMLTDRVVSLRHANIYEKHRYRHLISAVMIENVGETAVEARSHYAVYRTGTDGATKLFQTGEYADRIVLDGDAWRFQRKIVTFDTARIDSLLVTPI